LAVICAITYFCGLIGRNVLFIDVRNYSHRYIENVVVSARDFSHFTGGMGVPGNWGFSERTRVRLNVHIAFDADSRHYDLPARIWLLPFGRYTCNRREAATQR
jgi:hypothetical protein